MKKEINLIAAIIIMIVIGGGAFYGGTTYQKSQTAKTRASIAGRAPGQVGANGTNRAGQFGGAGARPISGQVISLSDTTATIKLKDGSSRIVVLAGSTTYGKSTVGTKTDLAQGSQVMVVGTQNSDGSLTAQSVQISPASQ